MADPIITLSNADLAIVRRVVSWWRRHYDVRGRSVANEDLPTIGAMYVAYTPTTGIPALSIGDLSGTGTGTVLTDDEPGAAECDIYELIDDPDAPFLEPLGRSEYVFNISRQAVAGDRWVLISRDQFGRWHVLGSAGGAGGGGGENDPTTFPCTNLAALRKSDCVRVVISGPFVDEQEAILEYFNNQWTGSTVINYPGPEYTGTGTGTTGGQGVLIFSRSAGTLSLTLDGKPLIWCGGNRFIGGPLTGHDVPIGPPPAVAGCSGQTFTATVNCHQCPPQPGVVIPCCPEVELPETLYGQFSNCTGTMTSMEGLIIIMEGTDLCSGYGGGLYCWIPPENICESEIGLFSRPTLECTTAPDDFRIIWPSPNFVLPSSPIVCNPFYAQFEIPFSMGFQCGAGDEGSATLTITETPP